MVLGYTFIQTAINTKVNGQMMNRMVMAFIIFLMEVYIKDNGIKVFHKDKVRSHMIKVHLCKELKNISETG